MGEGRAGYISTYWVAGCTMGTHTKLKLRFATLHATQFNEISINQYQQRTAERQGGGQAAAGLPCCCKCK